MPASFLARLARGAGSMLTGSAPAKPANGGGWFGPQQPLPPQAPPDVAGRAFDYPFGFNLAAMPRSWEQTGFAELRGLADSYDLLRAVIETRKDQMERLTWRIRPRALSGGATDSDPRLPLLTQFFRAPDKQHGWASWLRMLLEDLLVIDAPTLYKRRSRGGALYALEVLDGATVKRLIDDWGRTPAPPAPAYQQILKGMPAVDYSADELIYAPRNPRIHKAYGFSPVEQVQMSVNIALRRQIYQLQYYTEGNVPEALIGVPETWNPDQIRQFQAYWDSLNAGDTAERRHAKFVPGGVAKTFVPVREPAMKDAFDEWLARVVCYAFSLPPTAFTAQVNRATAETAQEVALAEGLAPLQGWAKRLIDRVLAEEFGAADLEFAWDADRDADPAQTATIAADYVKAGIKSINEVRAELGLPPVAGGEQPKIQTAHGLVPLTQSASVSPTLSPAGRGKGEGTSTTKVSRSAKAGFDPDQPRDDHGMWTSDGGSDDNGVVPSLSGDGDDATKPVQVADSHQIMSDARSGGSSSGQVAQAETAGNISVGYATADVILQQQVAAGIKTQAEADELRARIKTNDAQANAIVNTALRGHVGIPDNWIAKPVGRSGESQPGVVYVNPDDPSDNVRIMPGDPLSENEGQQVPYVIDQKGEKNFLTTDGTRLSRNVGLATHIPVGQYRFSNR